MGIVVEHVFFLMKYLVIRCETCFWEGENTFLIKPIMKNYIEVIKNNEVIKIESKLSSFFGTKVRTQGDEKKGRIVIPYKNTNDLNRILELLEII